MALIHCPECNHNVSTQAIFCPSCGYPLQPIAEVPDPKIEYLVQQEKYRQEQRAIGQVLAVFGLVVVVAIFLISLVISAQTQTHKTYYCTYTTPIVYPATGTTQIFTTSETPCP